MRDSRKLSHRLSKSLIFTHFTPIVSLPATTWKPLDRAGNQNCGYLSLPLVHSHDLILSGVGCSPKCSCYSTKSALAHGEKTQFLVGSKQKCLFKSFFLHVQLPPLVSGRPNISTKKASTIEHCFLGPRGGTDCFLHLRYFYPSHFGGVER